MPSMNAETLFDWKEVWWVVERHGELCVGEGMLVMYV
jgi:hypothetical protein